MKKNVLLITVLALSLFSLKSKAQLANGSIAPDFSFTDLQGNTQHLYSYLNAGKTVFIDVSATWCYPCWLSHTSGSLENLYNAYGPSGTNELMVLLIEAESANTTAQLYGPAVSTGGYSVETQGNWVSGTSYPICDPSYSAITTFKNDYAISYYPTIYMICPDRSITKIDHGTATTASLYTAKSACSSAIASKDAEMMLSTSLNGPLRSCDSVSPTFRIGNVGTSTLTSATITLKVDGTTQKIFTWLGSLATYASTTFTGVKVGSSLPGAHTITCEVSNPNGSVDPTSTNNSTTLSFNIDPPIGGSLITESFESTGIPSSWNITNGGDPYTWSGSQPGVGYYFSSRCMTLKWFNIPSGDIDIITLNPMSFTGMTNQTLSFAVANCQKYSSTADRLVVETSTDCGVSWTAIYNKFGSALATVATSSSSFTPGYSVDWRIEVINLSTYSGQPNVLIRFKGISDSGNNIYIDDINISGTVGIDEANLVENVTIYPNPMSGKASVNFNLTGSNNVSVALLNTIGQLMANETLGTLNSGSHTYQIETSSFSNGLYFLNISVGNTIITKKISIQN